MTNTLADLLVKVKTFRATKRGLHTNVAGSWDGNEPSIFALETLSTVWEWSSSSFVEPTASLTEACKLIFFLTGKDGSKENFDACILANEAIFTIW